MRHSPGKFAPEATRLPARPILAGLPPTRFRGISRTVALAVAVAVLAAAAVLLVVASQSTAPTGTASTDQGDIATYTRIVDHMRQGQDYYAAAHVELIHGAYGTRSVFNWRLPALSWFTSRLPSLAWASAMLEMAAAGAILLAFHWLRACGRAVAFISVPALVLNLVACVAPDAVLFADIVAGLLIFISASAYGAKWPVLGFAAALLALFVRELAAPYVLICVFFALRERRQLETAAWLAGLAAFAAYFAWHCAMVKAQLGALDVAYPESWLQFGGPRFVLDTAAFNGVFITAPLWVTAILVPLALFGLLAWRGEGSARAGFTVAVYLALFLFVGKRFDYYWGALYTPLLMLGLPFLPGAVRDLAGALHRRSPAPVLIH